MESARPATEADLEDLVRLWEHAVQELEGQRGGGPLAGSLSRPDLPRFLKGALDEPERLLVVGSIDDVPVGLASVWADRSRREPIGQLELIFVEPNARQVGVADVMLALVLARCEEWGMSGVDSPALPGNRSAKSFFETQGMQARLLIMHRPLGGASRG